jgi:hypothetical protein
MNPLYILSAKHVFSKIYSIVSSGSRQYLSQVAKWFVQGTISFKLQEKRSSTPLDFQWWKIYRLHRGCLNPVQVLHSIEIKQRPLIKIFRTIRIRRSTVKWRGSRKLHSNFWSWFTKSLCERLHVLMSPVWKIIQPPLMRPPLSYKFTTSGHRERKSLSMNASVSLWFWTRHNSLQVKTSFILRQLTPQTLLEGSSFFFCIWY